MTTQPLDTIPTTLTANMWAVVQTRYGGPETLAFREIARPVIAADEVLVRVRAAGICRGGWHLMHGHPYLIRLAGFGLWAPKTQVPGMDVAGVVEAVGEGVTQFKPGDEVFGTAMGAGSFAEFAKFKVEKLALKPARLSFAEAAVVPVSAMAALKAVRDAGKVQAGQQVLIIGASGGVGSFAVQLSKIYGATVTAVASRDKLAMVKEIGADAVIDYTQQDVHCRGIQYDVIIDLGGNRSLRELRSMLAPRGTLVIAGGDNGGKWLCGIDRQLRALLWSPFVRQTLTSFISMENPQDLQTLKQWIEEGKLTPVLDRTFPLSRTADAMRYFEQGHTKGKVALVVGE